MQRTPIVIALLAALVLGVYFGGGLGRFVERHANVFPGENDALEEVPCAVFMSTGTLYEGSDGRITSVRSEPLLVCYTAVSNEDE